MTTTPRSCLIHSSEFICYFLVPFFANITFSYQCPRSRNRFPYYNRAKKKFENICGNSNYKFHKRHGRYGKGKKNNYFCLFYFIKNIDYSFIYIFLRNLMYSILIITIAMAKNQMTNEQRSKSS